MFSLYVLELFILKLNINVFYLHECTMAIDDKKRVNSMTVVNIHIVIIKTYDAQAYDINLFEVMSINNSDWIKIRFSEVALEF